MAEIATAPVSAARRSAANAALRCIAIRTRLVLCGVGRRRELAQPALGRESHLFGDVDGVIADPLQAASDKDMPQRHSRWSEGASRSKVASNTCRLSWSIASSSALIRCASATLRLVNAVSASRSCAAPRTVISESLSPVRWRSATYGSTASSCSLIN